MTVKLSPGSSRGIAAQRFGQELRRAMVTREVGALRLAEAAGVAKSAIANWKAGGNLPRVDTANRLAEVLDWPKLVTLARAGRTVTCARCRRDFVNEGGSPARFCSVDCREVAVQLRRPGAGAVLAAALRGELERKAAVRGGLTKAPLEAALAEYARSDSKRTMRQDKLVAQLDGIRAAVDAMCRGCEPAGVCRSVECPLRPVSPLPLQTTEARGPVRPVEGPWGPSHREAQLTAIRAANDERWDRPGERERASERSAARWAAMTVEERAAAGQAISAGRRSA